MSLLLRQQMTTCDLEPFVKTWKLRNCFNLYQSIEPSGLKHDAVEIIILIGQTVRQMLSEKMSITFEFPVRQPLTVFFFQPRECHMSSLNYFTLAVYVYNIRER